MNLPILHTNELTSASYMARFPGTRHEPLIHYLTSAHTTGVSDSAALRSTRKLSSARQAHVLDQLGMEIVQRYLAYYIIIGINFILLYASQQKSWYLQVFAEKIGVFADFSHKISW